MSYFGQETNHRGYRSPRPWRSRGVTVELDGWNVGLNKVRLTQTLRASGYPLSEAARHTGQLLDGLTVRVSMPQFATVVEARTALQGLGVRNVRG